MSLVGQAQRAIRARVITLFREELSDRYLGDRTDRAGNSNSAPDGLACAATVLIGFPSIHGPFPEGLAIEHPRDNNLGLRDSVLAAVCRSPGSNGFREGNAYS